MATQGDDFGNDDILGGDIVYSNNNNDGDLDILGMDTSAPKPKTQSPNKNVLGEDLIGSDGFDILGMASNQPI